jgi:CBS domain-containing membrane protein
MITVDEIMTTRPYTLPGTATLADAIRVMAEKSIRHIPILDARGKLEGLVTRHDVLAVLDSTLRAQTERRDPATIPLAEIMTREVVTVDVGANLRRAALCLEEHKYSCLPVMKGGRLRGIVTDADLVAVAINLLEQLETSEASEGRRE